MGAIKVANNFIEDAESQDYKKRLKAFMAEVNPKPSLATIEKLKQQYVKAREKQHDENPTS